MYASCVDSAMCVQTRVVTTAPSAVSGEQQDWCPPTPPVGAHMPGIPGLALEPVPGLVSARYWAMYQTPRPLRRYWIHTAPCVLVRTHAPYYNDTHYLSNLYGPLDIPGSCKWVGSIRIHAEFTLGMVVIDRKQHCLHI